MTSTTSTTSTTTTTTTTETAPTCLVCDNAFVVSPEWETGEIIECTGCGQEHEVQQAGPAVVLGLAPEVEEDWGE